MPRRAGGNSQPAQSWADKAAYDATAKKLAGSLQQKFRDLRRRRERRGESCGACGLRQDLLFELHKRLTDDSGEKEFQVNFVVTYFFR